MLEALEFLIIAILLIAIIFAGFRIYLRIRARKRLHKLLISAVGNISAPTEFPVSLPIIPDHELVDLLAVLRKGKIVHLIPETMTVDEPRTAFARITREVAAQLVEYLPKDARAETDHIDVAAAMGVRLVGERTDAFEITLLTEEEQIVPKQGYAQWEWSVVPKSSGQHWLIVSATAVVYLTSGATGKSTIETYRRHVNVHVQPMPKRVVLFFKRNWKWLLGRV